MAIHLTRDNSALVREFMLMRKQLNLYLNHFPRSEKYALSNRIRNTADDMYDLVVEGVKRYHKKTTLTSLDIKHEQLRMQIYLANELGYFGYKDGRQDVDISADDRLLCITRMIDSVGCLIGEWIKSQSDKDK